VHDSVDIWFGFFSEIKLLKAKPVPSQVLPVRQIQPCPVPVADALNDLLI
jgi:hypothetical protein